MLSAQITILPTQPVFLRRRQWVSRAALLGLVGSVATIDLAKQNEPDTHDTPYTPALSTRSISGVTSSGLSSIPSSIPITAPSAISLFFKKVLTVYLPNILLVASIVIAAVLVAPEIYYRLAPQDTVKIDRSSDGTPLGGHFDDGATMRSILKLMQIEGLVDETSTNQNNASHTPAAAATDSDQQVSIEKEPEPSAPVRYLPPRDVTLPEGDWIVIPRIGVRTQLNESSDPDAALESGAWKVPEFGDPGQLNLPMIVAAHRFGWDWWWQSEYWRYNSFYLLPDTEAGDRIEIIFDQRKWIYEIYDGEEGSEITDYDADLILYTCKFLTSPIRHFRYARLINPYADTQR